jgi:hypothetical protein
MWAQRLNNQSTSTQLLCKDMGTTPQGLQQAMSDNQEESLYNNVNS